MDREVAMDIRVGAVPSGRQGSRQSGSKRPIEAKVLAVRRARRPHAGGKAPGGAERRRTTTSHDPRNGKVLTLMVPDGADLPRDLASGNYAVFLRIVRH